MEKIGGRYWHEKSRSKKAGAPCYFCEDHIYAGYIYSLGERGIVLCVPCAHEFTNATAQAEKERFHHPIAGR